MLRARLRVQVTLPKAKNLEVLRARLGYRLPTTKPKAKCSNKQIASFGNKMCALFEKGAFRVCVSLSAVRTHAWQSQKLETGFGQLCSVYLSRV